jgi:Ca2+-binding EF-hand superfamily protein
MDLDGDGELSPEDELRSALSELIGERHMQDILIVSMRRNRNGSIDFDDFRTITQMKFEDGDKAQVDDIPNRLLRAKLVEKFAGSDAGAMSKYDWRKDFNTIDLDGDGNLQLSEIVQVLRGVLGVDDKLISALVDRADSDMNLVLSILKSFAEQWKLTWTTDQLS